MDKKPILRLDKINKHFGGVVTAKDVSFSLLPGEIMGLIGPNGAGKTTLLNIIGGIYKSDGGRLYFDELDITAKKAYERARMGIARTFQTPRFLRKSTIKDNLLLGTDLADQMGFLNSFFGKKGNSFTEELDKYLSVVEMSIDWEMDIESIPFGQRKMLEIVRALLTHPKVMLIDEPAAGLNRRELQQSVKLIRCAARRGIGIVIIEHAMDMIMNVCDNILVLNFGEVIGYGAPEKVSANPDVIAAYLGTRRAIK